MSTLPDMNTLSRRVKQIRERKIIRSWEYRQRNFSNGVWFRLKRILVDAAQAWAVDLKDADRLEADGFEPLPVGLELHPQKRIYFINPETLATLSTARSIPIRLDADLLQSQYIALVPHPQEPDVSYLFETYDSND